MVSHFIFTVLLCCYISSSYSSEASDSSSIESPAIAPDLKKRSVAEDTVADVGKTRVEDLASSDKTAVKGFSLIPRFIREIASKLSRPKREYDDRSSYNSQPVYSSSYSGSGPNLRYGGAPGSAVKYVSGEYSGGNQYSSGEYANSAQYSGNELDDSVYSSKNSDSYNSDSYKDDGSSSTNRQPVIYIIAVPVPTPSNFYSSPTPYLPGQDLPYSTYSTTGIQSYVNGMLSGYSPSQSPYSPSSSAYSPYSPSPSAYSPYSASSSAYSPYSPGSSGYSSYSPSSSGYSAYSSSQPGYSANPYSPTQNYGSNPYSSAVSYGSLYQQAPMPSYYPSASSSFYPGVPAYSASAYQAPYANPYATAYANPYATAYANPYATAYANPYANPYAAPYAMPYNPYASYATTTTTMGPA